MGYTEKLFVFFAGVIFSFNVFALELTSQDFNNRENIPQDCTCDASDFSNSSPALSWKGAPARVKTYALICEDLDVSGEGWVHWIIFNIPKNIKNLPKGLQLDEELPMGMKQGLNSFGTVGYKGPCPPAGEKHSYIFRLYALNSELELKPKISKKEFLEAIKGKVLDKTELVGLYRRE